MRGCFACEHNERLISDIVAKSAGCRRSWVIVLKKLETHQVAQDEVDQSLSA